MIFKKKVTGLQETFTYTLRAILPILLTVLLGYTVRRIGPWEETFYKQLNKLCFHLFLPLHLFCSVYSINDLASMNWTLIGFVFACIFACAGLGLLAAHFIPRRDQKAVITQCAFRSNQAILGLPLAQALGGEAAMGFASVATSICVPLYNVLAVIVLTSFSGDGSRRPTARELLRRVASNPLIIGTLAALVMVLVRQVLPTVDGQPLFTLKNNLPSLFQAITNLSKVASPVMLFVLGARLDFSAVKELLPQLSLGIVLRLLAAPAIIVGGSILLRGPLGLTTVEMPTLVAVSATPVAVSSAVMVQEIGGDDQLASQLVVWTTALSLVTIFCIVYLLRSFAFL